MPWFRVEGVSAEGGGVRTTVFVDAPDEALAAAVLVSRGFRVERVGPIAEADLPADAPRQRVRPAAPPRVVPPWQRRARLVAVGLGLGLLAILAVLFVHRARQHLTRTDIRPSIPANKLPPVPLAPAPPAPPAAPAPPGQ